jgi:excinuclease ABC subunit B
MYADEMTDSMRRAISETHRRRQLQQEYNAENGINPQTIRRAVSDILVMLGRGDNSGPASTAPVPGSDRRSRRHDRSRSDLAGMPKADLSRLISALEDEMHTASADLRFEYAARLRDEVADLKKELKALAEMGVAVK